MGGLVATSFSTGYDNSCLLTGSGAVDCWGRNDEGQLGTGSETTTAPMGILTPVPVVGLPLPATTVYASRLGTCALLNNGALWCWGSAIRREQPDEGRGGRPVVRPSLRGSVGVGRRVRDNATDFENPIGYHRGRCL